MLATAMLAAAAGPSSAQTDPFPDSTAKYIGEWRDSRFGMFIHFDPISQKGTEISWSRGSEVPREEYDNLYKAFNPIGFNAKEWVDLAKAGGVRYVTFTTKHHDGFSMWDSKYSDYNIMHTPFARDLVQELSDECRRQGIRFDAYYSITDWYQPDWMTTTFGGPGYALPAGQAPDVNRYLVYAKNQLTELVQKYDPGVIWFDRGDVGHWTPAMGWDVYGTLKHLKPSIVLNNRAGWGPDHATLTPGYAGDFSTPEKFIGAYNDKQPWETCNTIADQWSYKPNNPLRPTAGYIRELVKVIGGDGNYMLNLGPGPDGKFVPEEAAMFRTIGKWVTAHADGIYETRGGPYLPGGWGGATRKGNKIYLHILAWPWGDDFILPPLPQKILSFRRLGGGAMNAVQNDQGVTLTIPAAGRDSLAETVELTLVAPVTGQIRTAVTGSGFSLGLHGQWISKTATYEQSSVMADFNGDRDKLLTGESFAGEFAFHTQQEKGANIIIDLGQVRTVKGLEIENRQNPAFYDRAKTLAVWTSIDKVNWTETWAATEAQGLWAVLVLGTGAGGKPVEGANARYVKVGLRGTDYLHLKSVRVYGEPQPDQFSVPIRPSHRSPEKPTLDADAGSIRYSLPASMLMSLDVLDARGAVIGRLARGIQEKGRYAIALAMMADHPGLYWIRLTAGAEVRFQRVLVLR